MQGALAGPITSRNERRRVVDVAWSTYVEGGLEPAGVSDDIARSWRRARELHHLDPHLSRPRRVLTPDELAERSAGDEVFRLAAPILRDFTDRLTLSDHVLAYFDAEGWLLALDGDAQVADRLSEIGFAPGTSWAEEAAGTNGPGTALAAARPVEVFASEHYVAAWQRWSCAAAPVMPRGSAGPLGAVDITGPWEVRRRQALLIARVIARAVEERVRAALSVRDEVVRHALRAARASGDALLAVDSRGRVVAANDAASRHVPAGGELSSEVRAQIARSLAAPGDGDFSLASPDGATFVAWAVGYEGAAVGAVLRVAPPARRARPRPTAGARYDFVSILGDSGPLRRALERARAAARNDLPAVLLGESGTGKELFAHAIHAASERRAGAFVAVNCGCIPDELVEAEFFGYEAGAFTGARRDGRAGRFEEADGGTLFLDEVGELPLAAQTALLRVLQEKEVARVGGGAPRPVDVRVIAASNKPLDAEVRAKRFRRDLYYRLNVLPIAIPPLRDRGDDLLVLARAFLAEAEGEVRRRDLSLSPEAIALLRAHPWPGNVRELRNAILRAAATGASARLGAEDLLLDEEGDGAADAPADGAGDLPPAPGRRTVHELERDALVAAVAACGGNLTEAARRLGISRMTIYRWMAKHCVSRA